MLHLFAAQKSLRARMPRIIVSPTQISDAKRNRCLTCFVSLFTLFFAISLTTRTPAQETIGPQESYQAIAAQLTEALQEQLQDKQLPAVSIALVDDQEIVWSTGFGFQDEEQRIPANAETVYRVGSVSKLFTDLAIMQLVEKGQVDLDEDITKILPDFQPQLAEGQTITLRQLMSHQSGLVRESPVGNYFDPEEPSLQETVRSLNGLPLTYPPQTKTKYSNAGVAVVGYAVEKLTQAAFSEALDLAVLDPLEMENSGFEVDDRLSEHLADAQMWTHDGRTFTAPTFKLGTLPAGNLYSTVNDLSKFMSAIFNQGVGPSGKILEPETLDAMLSPQFEDQQGQSLYGIGFRVTELDGKKMVGHGGAVYGFSTQFHALPDQKLGVVVVTSKDGANDTMRRIAYHALRMMVAQREGNELPDWNSTQPVPAERAARLTGLFQTEDRTQSLRLRVRNEELTAQSGSYRYRVRALNDSQLIADDVHRFGTIIDVSSPDELKIGDSVFRRVADGRPDTLPERWAGLIGEYGWDHNTLYVFEDRGRLHCLIEWFYYYPLEEIEKDVFAFPDYGLYHGERLIFSRQDDFPATHVVAAEVRFDRREIGTVDGETFKIDPIKPIEEVRAGAMDAQPPVEIGSFAKTELIEVASLDDTIKLDIRYATTNNFMNAVFYQQPRAFMQRQAAEALVRAHRRLKPLGYGLLIHDAYRPWFVTKMFWDATPQDMKIFVANPASGSRHNRGCAVDLTLYDLDSGEPIPMGAGYDEFSTRSFPDYEVASSRQRWHRELLRHAMEREGFTIYEFEWWHFDFGEWQNYTIQNTPFEDLK